MRWIWTVTLALVLVGTVSSPACACSCVQTTTRESFERADAVFAGTLVSRDEQADKATLVFEVSDVYKGTVSARQEIVTHVSGATCGLELTGRGPHLVFGNAEGSDFEPSPDEGQYVGGLCGGSRPFDATARAELAGLGSQVKATKPVAAATPTDGTPVGWWIGGGGVALVAIAAVSALVWRRRHARLNPS